MRSFPRLDRCWREQVTALNFSFAWTKSVRSTCPGTAIWAARRHHWMSARWWIWKLYLSSSPAHPRVLHESFRDEVLLGCHSYFASRWSCCSQVLLDTWSILYIISADSPAQSLLSFWVLGKSSLWAFGSKFLPNSSRIALPDFVVGCLSQIVAITQSTIH